jgi:ABC transporter substrate binding protein
MSYGATLSELFRRSAWYVHRILLGTEPAELPIEQPTKFELTINLKTAKALGLTSPPAVLSRENDTARVHLGYRRCSGGTVAHCARAAAGDRVPGQQVPKCDGEPPQLVSPRPQKGRTRG